MTMPGICIINKTVQNKSSWRLYLHNFVMTDGNGVKMFPVIPWWMKHQGKLLPKQLKKGDDCHGMEKVKKSNLLQSQYSSKSQTNKILFG